MYPGRLRLAVRPGRAAAVESQNHKVGEQSAASSEIAQGFRNFGTSPYTQVGAHSDHGENPTAREEIAPRATPSNSISPERLPSLRCFPSNDSARSFNSRNESCRHRRVGWFGIAGASEVPHQVERMSTCGRRRRVESRERTGVGRVRFGVDEVEEGRQERRQRFECLRGHYSAGSVFRNLQRRERG